MDAAMRKGLLAGGQLLATVHPGGGAMAMPGMIMSSKSGSMSLLGVRLAAGSVFSLSYFGGYLWMWAVMLVAMMFPVALPSVRRYRQLRSPLTPARLAGFTSAYFVVYLSAGALTYLILAVLQSWSSRATVNEARIAALVVALVGVYQLSRRKALLLESCSACDCGVREVRQGPLAGLHDGFSHGWACLSCCGPLMVVMLLIGMMNLAWMAVLMVVMLGERLPGGRLVPRLAGGAILGSALLILIAPGRFPTL